MGCFSTTQGGQSSTECIDVRIPGKTAAVAPVADALLAAAEATLRAATIQVVRPNARLRPNAWPPAAHAVNRSASAVTFSCEAGVVVHVTLEIVGGKNSVWRIQRRQRWTGNRQLSACVLTSSARTLPPTKQHGRNITSAKHHRAQQR